MEKVVLPGEFLSTEEEYAEGKKSYSADGGVYASVLGTSEYSKENRDVSVNGFKNVRRLKRGDIVYGRVSIVKDNMVGIDLLRAEPKKGERVAMTSSYAAILVRNVSREYVKNLREFFRIGDVVRAKVDGVKPYGIDLRTDEQDLGVVEGYCSNCRSKLVKAGSEFKCLACGSNEKRKIAEQVRG